jgi:hypothetical protein
LDRQRLGRRALTSGVCYHLRVRVFLVVLVLAGATCKAPPSPRLEIESATAGDDAAALIHDANQRAEHDHRRLLVYVGAKWCEPCRRFHEAAERGELVGRFGELRLYEFDLDRDGARLARAGYNPRLIPLFALPQPDGRASGRQIEGSIKGDGAVANISPRLAALLDSPN